MQWQEKTRPALSILLIQCSLDRASLKKLSVSTNIAKNLTGGRSVFIFRSFFSDSNFICKEGRRQIYTCCSIIMTTRLLVQAFLWWPSRTCTRALILNTCNTIAWHTHKIVTQANHCEYSRVRLRVLASTGEFDCECSWVRLRVLECSFASTREYSRV